MHRGRIAAGLLALATCFAFVAVTNSTAFAGSGQNTAPAAAPIRPAAPETSTDTADGRTLSADGAIALTETGATVKVVGAGFDPATDVFLAICNTTATAQTPLADCLGGPVPAANPTKAWAWVTAAANRPNPVKWEGGGFTAKLVIDSPDGIGPVCGDNKCVIIARTDGAADARAADLIIPVTFTGEGPPTPSSTSETTTTTTITTTTTSTSAEPTVPLTVGPQSVVSPEIAVGGVQTVVFAEFLAGEQVTIGLFPGPIALPDVLASEVGVVTISFTIESAMNPGIHTVQAVGVQSGTVGIAEFTISAPVVTSSSIQSTSSVDSSTQTTTSTTPTSESTTATEATSTTTSTDAAPIVTDGESSSLWWLWVIIVLVVLVGGVTGAVALSRRRAAQLEEEEEAKEAELAEAAERTAQDRTAGQQPYQPEAAPPSPYEYSGDDLGLLSGREHADGPALYSGQGSYTPEARTERLQSPEQRGLAQPRVEPPTTRIPAPGSPPAGGQPPTDPGPSTAQWRPDFGDSAADPRPSTAQWRPDFGDSAADPGPSTSQWRPDFDDSAVESGTPDAVSGSDPADGGPTTQAWQPPPIDPEDEPPAGRHS